MKYVLCLLLVCNICFAEENRFELLKKNRLAELEKTKSCVEASTNRAELRKCWQNVVEDRQQRRKEFKGKKRLQKNEAN